MRPEDRSMITEYKPKLKTPPRQNDIMAEAAGEFGITPRWEFVSGMVSRGLREDFIRCLILFSKSVLSVGVFSMIIVAELIVLHVCIDPGPGIYI
jgi:hypothetical protein